MSHSVLQRCWKKQADRGAQLPMLCSAVLLLPPLSASTVRARARACNLLSARPELQLLNVVKTMTGIAAASFFSNICQFEGCGLHFESLAELIAHIEDNHIGKWSRGNAIRAAGVRAAMATITLTSCVAEALLLGVVKRCD
ncbi:Zinc finger protein 1 TAK1-interacting protein 27 [Triplophysa tibetana]|uniref:Zinc finger protein 1 TAK1-interacting protein 27 n=1 Tax=Triplophysa tibetana TaxID=1572043 RepID=A0A5A9MZ79_9TELE|nr:Zinc finger protein 1 TAK1-interacting protein 27 [Triplophysa tibetana]